LLYGRDARWEADDTPADVISWGAPILLTQETFKRDFLGALGRPGPAAPRWGTAW
jgi:hypothetical protein